MKTKKSRKIISGSDHELLTALLNAQDKGIYFSEYLNNLFQKYKIEGDLLTGSLEYFKEVINGNTYGDDYLEIDLFKYFEDTEIVLDSKQVNLALYICAQSGYGIPYSYFYKNPNFLNTILKNGDPEISYPPKITPIPKKTRRPAPTPQSPADGKRAQRAARLGLRACPMTIPG